MRPRGPPLFRGNALTGPRVAGSRFSKASHAFSRFPIPTADASFSRERFHPHPSPYQLSIYVINQLIKQSAVSKRVYVCFSKWLSPLPSDPLASGDRHWVGALPIWASQHLYRDASPRHRYQLSLGLVPGASSFAPPPSPLPLASPYRYQGVFRRHIMRSMPGG